jgi:formamidopyrimidine-DNA glycosylase
MPELPEVETTRRGIAPHLIGQVVTDVVVRQSRLRWPVPARLRRQLSGQLIHDVTRRGKYLLLHAEAGTVILHLGMSGSLRLVTADEASRRHDHVDIVFANRRTLRLRDPRRFGAVLWTTRQPQAHPLLRSLGPEPLEDDFSADYLFTRTRGRRVAIKPLIMDSKVVVGVGNIYASEALFLAGIRPGGAAGRISRVRCGHLVNAIRAVLTEAITAGGTTLRDFSNGEGKPGYFQQRLQVYGRAGEACRHCGETIRHKMLGQRATYYCIHCQC